MTCSKTSYRQLQDCRRQLQAAAGLLQAAAGMLQTAAGLAPTAAGQLQDLLQRQAAARNVGPATENFLKHRKNLETQERILKRFGTCLLVGILVTSDE